jgi:hypothetical protein
MNGLRESVFAGDFSMKLMQLPVPGDLKGTILGMIEIPDNDVTRIITQKDTLSSIKLFLILRMHYPAIDKCSSNEIAGLMGMNPTSIRKIRKQIREACREYDLAK